MVAMMRRRRAAWGLIGLALCAPGGVAVVSLPGCGQSAQTTGGASTSQRPDSEITWTGRGGFSIWGCDGEYLHAISIDPRVLDVWKWKGDQLAKHAELPAADDFLLAWLPGDRYVRIPIFRGDHQPDYLEIRSLGSASPVRHWPIAEGWYCDLIRASRNGKYVGVHLAENIARPTPGYDVLHPRAIIGLIGAELKEVTWFPTLVQRQLGGDLRSVLPSDDGAYVAVAAWDAEGGVTMIDVATKQKLWSRRPGSNAIYYVAFSPDSQVVYGGGTEGAVYAMDVKTGNVLSKWYASESGTEEYGHRISCLAISPDGRWVAAGSGPEGLVFIGSTATNKCVKILNHGMGTILLVHFSPDSRALATFVPGTLKIWNVSQWDKTPAAQASATTQTTQTQAGATQTATRRSGMGRP